MGSEKDREKRLASAGKWFEPGIKTKTNIWSNIVLPIILIISFLLTLYIALSWDKAKIWSNNKIK